MAFHKEANMKIVVVIDIGRVLMALVLLSQFLG